jgi:UDP-N-acetylmuramoyl-tripeptide--D-alanyl-D-alanine ligase
MLHMTVKQLAGYSGGEIIGGDIRKYENHIITRFSTDSRDIDDSTLFVPVIGENVDAHKFIPDVLDSGCVVSLTSRDPQSLGYDGDRILIKVDDTVAAMQEIGKQLRTQIHVPIVGVTGSVGKTTTRQMIVAALSAGGKVFATSGNKNSQIGVPLTMAEFDDRAYVGVLEMGMSEPGEMHKLAAVVRPDLAVMTNIGTAHIQQLGSKENILQEKLHITDYMDPGSYVILNGDDPLLRHAQLAAGLIPVYYGTTADCDAYASDIDMSRGCPRFTAIVFGQRIHIQLKMYGRHMIMNALAALCVAHCYAVNLEKAAEKLCEMSGFAHRQQFLDRGDLLIIDDTYNASPDSMRAGLEILSTIECTGRRIAVLADMRELGDQTEPAHRAIGEFISFNKSADIVLTYGEAAKLITDSIDNDEIIRLHYTDRAQLDAYLADHVQRGDLVYFKGSNSMKLGESVSALYGGLK